MIPGLTLAVCMSANLLLAELLHGFFMRRTEKLVQLLLLLIVVALCVCVWCGVCVVWCGVVCVCGVWCGVCDVCCDVWCGVVWLSLIHI